MSVKQLSTAVLAIAFGTCTFTSQANNNGWPPYQPGNQYQTGNQYWQAPNWSGQNTQRPAPSAPPAYGSRYPVDNYPQSNSNRNAPPPPPPGPYRGSSEAPRQPAPAQRQVMRTEPYYRGAPAPRQQGAYNGPSAFHTPGYNQYRDNRRSNNPWGGNKFWGGSGPSTWMNPNKRNWENSWDDMINSPSRMGEMPGGWTAPEVSVPNPVDMGDQMQDNVQDLPSQMKDGNIGNDVSN